MVFLECEIVLERGFRIDFDFCGDIAGIGTFDDLFFPVDLQGVEAIVVV